jgi:lysophospholipase L1-like esterase
MAGSVAADCNSWCVNLVPHTKGGTVRLMAWVLLATVALISGCGGDPPPASRSEPAVLTPTPDPSVAYVGIIGDSYTSGLPSGGNDPNAWPTLVTTLLKNQGVTIKPSIGATNGSGYGKHRGKGSVLFFDQVHQAVGTKDKLVILFGAELDRTALPDRADAMAAAVQRTLVKATKGAPDAKLLVIGPAWMQTNPPPELLQLRDIVKAQAEAIGATFVDPLAEGWFTDHPEMIGPNGDRPNQAGHVLMAEKIAPLIAQQLQLPPAP